MQQRRWFNPNLPQTLAIAQILLYLDAFWALLSLLTVDLGGIALLIGAAAVAAYVYGGYGVANELRRGYQVAVIASFLPLGMRAVQALLYGDGLVGDLGYILLAGNVLNVLFEYALIALLLHPMSRDHQKIWFS